MAREHDKELIVNEGSDAPICSWDFVEACTGKKCGIHERCKYFQEGKTVPKPELLEWGKNPPCLVQKHYVNSVYTALTNPNRGELSPEDAVRVGLFVMPLFGSLIKMKIAEASMNGVVYFNKQGNPAINPIYREMRETMRSIDSILHGIGVSQIATPEEADYINGDPSYYERMMNEGGQEVGKNGGSSNSESTRTSEEGEYISSDDPAYSTGRILRKIKR